MYLTGISTKELRPAKWQWRLWKFLPNYGYCIRCEGTWTDFRRLCKQGGKCLTSSINCAQRNVFPVKFFIAYIPRYSRGQLFHLETVNKIAQGDTAWLCLTLTFRIFYTCPAHLHPCTFTHVFRVNNSKKNNIYIKDRRGSCWAIYGWKGPNSKYGLQINTASDRYVSRLTELTLWKTLTPVSSEFWIIFNRITVNPRRPAV